MAAVTARHIFVRRSRALRRARVVAAQEIVEEMIRAKTGEASLQERQIPCGINGQRIVDDTHKSAFRRLLDVESRHAG